MSTGDCMLPDKDIMRYSRYLAKRYSWILDARRDYTLEDLEVMGAMAIVQAVKAEGLDTTKWASVAAMYFKTILREELAIFGNWKRYEMGTNYGKVQLNAPITDDENVTLEETLADPDQQPSYSRLFTADVCRTLDEALAKIDDDLTRECIMLHYMYQVPEKDIAAALQCDVTKIRNMRERGMRILRNDYRLRKLFLEDGIDEITPFYKATGLAAWRASGLSAPERLTIWREEHRIKQKREQI